MNILTKICIGVLVLLVLVAAPVFITKATVDPNYKDAYNKAVAEANSLRVAAASVQVALGGMADQNKRLAGELQAAQDARTKSEKDREADAVKAMADKATLELDLMNLQTLSLVSNSGTVLSTTLAADLQKELTKAQGDAAEAKTKLHETKIELANQTSLNDRMNKQVQALKDQMDAQTAELFELRKTAGKGAVATGAADQTAPTAAEKFSGTVTSVKGDLVGINIGSSNGVKKGDKLIIYRNGKGFIGKLKIEELNATESAGVIVDKIADPIQGDNVTNTVQS